MLTLDTRHVTALQGGDGQAFTRFVDAVLRASLARASIAQNHIQTNQKNQADGGVDTAVELAVAGDPSGFLASPTCWQYKAQSQSGISRARIQEEINKTGATELIRRGYAWRLAIADEVSHERREEWKTAADEAIRQVNAAAPGAMIVTASDLASWASRYLAVVLHVAPAPSAAFLDHRTQRQNVQHGATPNFVGVPRWDAIKQALRTHVDFAHLPASPVLTVQGEAGVGKTRLVFETLSELDNVEHLAVYTERADAAESIAHHLARTDDASCVLVVDECSPELRASLERVMQGSRPRCRVIALDNSGVVASRAAREEILPKMDGAELADVLATNFPHLPKDRQRAYANAAEGFVKLAADLCADDPLGTSDSLVVPGGIEAYVQRRLADRRMALETVALVWRCGFRDDLAVEFRALCAWLEIDEAAVRAQLKQIKDRPGFVRDLGRYAYVTPDLVARLAFKWGWDRWADHDAEKFLKAVPDSLLDSFLKRVQHSGDEEVRRRVGAYFRGWLESLTVEDVRDAATVKRATLLVEADAAANLPVLERLVSSMSIDDLRTVQGRATSGWGPRRHLVWLLEQLARLPECFRASEAILRRLAVAESEPEIGNNATAIYRQHFRIYGSGTGTPYLERAAILRRILDSATAVERLLAVSAVDASLESGGFRLVGRSFVAGRLPPDEWNPSTGEENVAASREAVGLLSAATQNALDEVRQAAIATLVKRTRRLLHGGFLDSLRSALTDRTVVEQHGPELLREIDAFLRWDVERHDESYLVEVRAWLAEVAPDDLRGRLTRYVGGWPSVLSTDPALSEWKQKIADLARELVADTQAFALHLPWLSSDKAGAAGALGAHIGELDVRGDLLGMIVAAAAATTETALARGYCAAYLSRSSESAAQVASALDQVEDAAPSTAYEVSLAAEPVSAAVRRVRRLVTSGKLPAAALAAHRFKYGSESVPPQDAVAVLGDLVEAARNGDSRALREAVGLVASWFGSHGKPGLAADPAVRALAWDVVEIAAAGDGAEGYHWAEVLRALAEDDPARVIRLCVQALLSDSLALNDEATAELSRLAPIHGAVVVAELGRAMLDEERGWTLQVGTFRGLVAGLPLEALKTWLTTAGVAGARAIARHLMAPHVANGVAILHPLTEYVLSRFEDDDETFSSFFAGTHSMQMYSGDIAAQHQAEADAARPLLDHPLRRVREWAQLEVRQGEADADRWRRYKQERETDF